VTTNSVEPHIAHRARIPGKGDAPEPTAVGSAAQHSLMPHLVRALACFGGGVAPVELGDRLGRSARKR
jgi:hypothetical protein